MRSAQWMRNGIIATIGLALTGIAASALAEAVSVLENQYEPLVSTKQGRIETCGFGFNMSDVSTHETD
jgi:hypothetical protein